MNTRKNRSGETSHAHPKEWLNLSLGPYVGYTRPTTSMKEYTCTFCGRKFYSPQALGGHQNGHRRERDAIRRYCARAFQMHQSIDVHSNVLVGKPVRDLVTNVARFSDHEDGFGVACVQPYAEEESVDLKWPGSFYFNPQPASQQSDPSLLNLNLKL